MDLDPKPGSGLKSEEVMRRHILPKALVIGLVAGLISSAFREVLQWSEIHRIAWLHQLSSMERLLAAVCVGAAGGVWDYGSCAGSPPKHRAAVSPTSNPLFSEKSSCAGGECCR